MWVEVFVPWLRCWPKTLRTYPGTQYQGHENCINECHLSVSTVFPTHACNLQLAKFCYCSSGATEGEAFRPGVRWGPWSRSQNGSHMWELLLLPTTWILRWWRVSFCRNIRLTLFFSNTRIILPRTECFLKLCLIGYIWKSYGNKSLIFQFPLKFVVILWNV